MRTHVSRIAAGSLVVLLSTATATAQSTPAVLPSDATMTCEQIATELAPYAQQMGPMVGQLNETNQELVARGKARMAQETPYAIGMTAAATAASADPTGVSQKAVNAAMAAHQQEVWNRALAEDKPLADRQKAQTSALMAQARQMQSNARLQRLMQLAQEKGCTGQQR